jgi:hypothetical protein
MAATPVSFKENVLIVSATPTATSPGAPAHRVSGWGEGEDVFMGERLEDAISHKMGADGKMSPNINANRAGKITIKLMETSPSNAVLRYINALQEGGSQSFAPINVLFQGITTGDSVGGVSGYIQKVADIKRGNGVNEQEWVIVVEEYDVLLGRRTVTL